MQVRIKESGTLASFAVTAPESGIDWTNDFVGNHNAFNDGQFTRNEETDELECDQDTFDWWFDLCERYQAANDRAHELGKKHGREEVSKVLQDISADDLDVLPEMMQAAMTDAFGEDE